MALFFVDNNLLRKLFKMTQEEYERLFHQVFSRHDFPNRTYNFKSSPYLVLEAIGIRPTFIKDISIPKRFVERIRVFDSDGRVGDLRDEVEALMNYLMDEYRERIFNHERLSEASIRRQIELTEERYVEAGRWIYDDVVRSHLCDLHEYREYISSWFSLEKTLSQNYPRTIIRNVFAYLINTANAFFGDFRSNSFSKMYYTLAFDLQKEVSNRNIQAFKNRKIQYQKLNLNEKKFKKRRSRYYKLKRFKDKVLLNKSTAKKVFEISGYGLSRDNVDSEMIHLLLFGSFDSDQNVRRPIFAFSSDKVETIVARICLYKWIAKSGWALRNIDKLPLGEGWFYHFDSERGEFTKAVSVKNVVTLDGALCQGKGFDYIMERAIVNL